MSRPSQILAALVMLSLAACGGGDPAVSSPDGQTASPEAVRKVAVIPKGNSHEFWQAVRRGALLADQADPSISVEFKGPEKENDPEQQKALVEIYLNTGYDAIGIAPVNGTTLAEVVDRAKGMGKPVVVFDSAVATDTWDSFIATDNRAAGELAGTHLASLLGGEGRVILVRYQVGSASTEAREAGFLDAMAKHPGIELISKDQEGANREQELAQQLLVQFGDRVNGIFTPNESTTRGMMLALQSGGHYAKGVVHVGFDATPEFIASVEVDELKGFVIQNPVKMGFLTVKTLGQLLDGKLAARTIDTGAVLVTPANIADPAIRRIMANEWTP